MSTPAATKYNQLLISRKLRIADSTVLINDILDTMNHARSVNKPLVVIVDYLQIIPLHAAGGASSRYEKLKNMI